MHDCGNESISLVMNDEQVSLLFENITVENNILYNSYKVTGVQIGQSSTNTYRNFHIRNNLIYDDPDATVTAPEGFEHHSIDIWNEGTGTIEDINIYNNVILYTTYSCIEVGDTGPMTVNIHNNTFYGVNLNQTDYLALVGITGPSANATVINNIFYNDSASSQNCENIYVQYAGTTQIEYNLHYLVDQNARLILIVSDEYYLSDWSVYLADTGYDINSPVPDDPLFVDSDNGDFSLQAGSPAIDAGTDLGYPFQGIAPDIGAFEYVP